MCIYQTLAYEEHHGYVIYCMECRLFQLGFGCILINFSQTELNSFSRVVHEIAEDYEDLPGNHQKTVRIPTPCDSLSLCLSSIEVRILSDMLEKTDTELVSRSLLDLFRN